MSPKERAFPASPIVERSTGAIASPFQFLFTGEDNIRVRTYNAVAGVTLRLQGRFLRRDGTIDAFTFEHPLTDTRVRQEKRYPLGDGFLLNLVCLALGATTQRGQTFLAVDVVRGFAGAITRLGTIIQGYIASEIGLVYPGSPIAMPVEGPGAIKREGVPGFPLNTPATMSVPAETRWRIHGVRCDLATDATAVNRRPFVEFSESGKFTHSAGSSVLQGASLTRSHIWSAGVSSDSQVSSLRGLAGLPAANMLRTGWIVRVATENFQAGDSHPDYELLIEEWIEPQTVVAD